MYLAQFNIAWMRFPFDDPRFDSFKAWLNALHALAEKSEGFVWRYEGEKDKGGFIQPYPETEPLVMGNISVWKDFDSLKQYVFTDGHLEIMRNKRDWFHSPAGRPYSVMWWVPEKDITVLAQTVDKAKARLEILRSFGPGPLAFTFAKPWLDTNILETGQGDDLIYLHSKS